MAISELLSVAGGFLSDTPSSLMLTVTNRCNARCRICFNWDILNDPQRNELTLEELKKVAQNLKGLHSLLLTGGEPLLRGDLFEIIGLFHSLANIKQVTIPTNLFKEDSTEIIERIANAYPDLHVRVVISIDGIGELHDEIRAHDGGFDKLMANYELLKLYRERGAKNLSLSVATVLSAFNSDKIIETIDFISTLDIDYIKVIKIRDDAKEEAACDISNDTYIKAASHAEELTYGRDNKASYYENLLASVSLVAKEMIGETLSAKQCDIRCNAGKKYITISDIGEVSPCELLDLSFGNLRDNNYDIKGLLASERAKEINKEIKNKRCFCTLDCNVVSNVVFTPSLYPRVMKKFLRFYKKAG